MPFTSSRRRRAVYAMTNATPNAIQIFHRANDGTLTAGASYPTGGNGSPSNPPAGFPVLESQNALVLSRDGKLLFAVNAGSHTISSFIVQDDGGLQLAGQVASGGDRPVSLALHEHVLYVANADSRTIQGYSVRDGGKLTKIPRASRRVKGVGIAMIGFHPSGDILVIASRGDGQPKGTLETVTVDGNGIPGRVQAWDVVRAGQVPFGFAFDRRGHVILSNLGNNADSTVSVYGVSRDGELRAIMEQPIFTSAACWVATTVVGLSNIAFVTSAASRAVTGLRIGIKGRLTPVGPLSPTEQTAFTSGLALDCAVGGSFLYVLSAGGFSRPPFTSRAPAVIDGFRIHRGGTLTSLGAPAGSLAQGTTGIVAV